MITLVILSYNHSAYIIETLESIYSVDVEKKVIIVDDGSSDASVELVRNYINQNCLEGITRLVVKKNKGLIDSLNLALEMSDTEYVYFTASDDVVVVDQFKSLYSMIKQRKDTAMIIGNAYVYHEGQPLSRMTYNQEHIRFFELADSLVNREIFMNFPKPLLLQGTIFRTSALNKINGWDTDLKWDDYPVFVKLFNAYSIENREIIFCPDITIVKYRQHPNNTYKNVINQVDMVEKALLKLAPKNILSRALAKQYAFYFLLSIKEKKFSVAKEIFKRSFRSRFISLFFYYIINVGMRQLIKQVNK
ncbi:glycosyltransferase family A protein [Erwinia persicina]|uniref:Glycosyltransferase family 2 protein n=1 Tax=Erwinia persicina TaxID=55211 RepID=A0A4U3F9D5_9GAMM|nr:glycosyltransferase family A protein [Erwinia persicina]MBD8105572.1 glycosyltransferase family 2 protein [Erwinia persicina]MBD8209662.1 glycosyltransferase family 2 protein [Erwinia persicina]TKJ89345.1 hypothetical protein EpCFBP13511_13645 [Erwinia persicina]